MISVMSEVTSELFDHLEINSSMEVDRSISYTQPILKGAGLKKYKAVLRACKDFAKDLAGDKSTLGDLKELYVEDFCTWSKIVGLEDDGDAYLVLDK